MIKKGVIIRKLSTLRGYVDELRQLAPRPLAVYLSDNVYRRAVERLLQITIECAIDCNNLIIVGLQHRPATDHKSSFIILGDLAVLDREFARRLLAYVKTRNVIVHEYEKLTDELVYAAMQTAVVDFTKYRAQVLSFLSNQDNRRGDLHVNQQR